ncbi:hypothetical protein CRUP_019087 [Coryphaenoides rupestris]|nr:hypothetical protein CRUP_019087 [Coryphaenoides rupestris]
MRLSQSRSSSVLSTRVERRFSEVLSKRWRMSSVELSILLATASAWLVSSRLMVLSLASVGAHLSLEELGVVRGAGLELLDSAARTLASAMLVCSLSPISCRSLASSSARSWVKGTSLVLRLSRYRASSDMVSWVFDSIPDDDVRETGRKIAIILLGTSVGSGRGRRGERCCDGLAYWVTLATVFHLRSSYSLRFSIILTPLESRGEQVRFHLLHVLGHLDEDILGYLAPNVLQGHVGHRGRVQQGTYSGGLCPHRPAIKTPWRGQASTDHRHTAPEDSVCNANVVLMKPTWSMNLELVKNAFWDYVAKATIITEGSLAQIKQSELGQEVNARISKNAEALNQYTVALQTQVAPLTQDLLAKLSQEAELLKAHVDADLTSAGAALQPHVDEVKEDLQRQMAALTKEVAAYARALDAETLGATVQQKSQELKERLDRSLQAIRGQVGPLADELKQKVDQSVAEFQRNMEPITQNFQSQLVRRSQEIQQSLAPLEVKARLSANAQDLQAQLAQLWKSFAEKIQ